MKTSAEIRRQYEQLLAAVLLTIGICVGVMVKIMFGNIGALVLTLAGSMLVAVRSFQIVRGDQCPDS